jgi:hypothetical protein
MQVDKVEATPMLNGPKDPMAMATGVGQCTGTAESAS